MNDENKINVAAVVGPTASGKTRLGVSLALALDGEVISADSMQIYEGLDIASAKPTKEEMKGVPHHLIGIIPRSEEFSVARYVELAKAKIIEVTARGKLPIIVGGTGLYVDSLLNNIQFTENEADKALRSELFEKAEREGARAIWNDLFAVDPEAAEKIEPNNVKRVIRALEVFKTTGVTMTEQNRRSRLAPSPYRAVKVGLKTSDRSVLYDRINRRADEMLEMGLLEEAREFLSDSSVGETAAKAIGCKELAPYFDGTQPLDEAMETMKRETRRYAKRQLTWFLRDEAIRWFNSDEYSDFTEIEELAAAHIKNRLQSFEA